MFTFQILNIRTEDGWFLARFLIKDILKEKILKQMHDSQHQLMFCKQELSKQMWNYCAFQI